MKANTKTAAAEQPVELKHDRQVDLGQLYLASELPGDAKLNSSLHVRKADDDPASFATLKASIAAIGIIQPLIVLRHAGKLYVVSGNRRLMALRELCAGADERTDFNVPVIEIADASVGQLRELAVMANLVLPMHPVDQLEVIAGALKAGMSRTDIGLRWGKSDRQVLQLLALGELAPAVRDAWRAGDIDAKTAQTFTLGDPAAQNKALAKLSKHRGRFDSWEVKRELVGNKAEAGKLIEFVGIEAYRAAGGKVTEDLFGVDHVVSDAALVKKLASEKLDRAMAQLVEQGWAWATAKPGDAYAYGSIEPAKKGKLTEEEQHEIAAAEAGPDDDDEDGETSWDVQTRIDAAVKMRSFSEDERKRSGCFVAIGNSGALVVDAGRIKPEEKKREAAQAGAAKRKKKAKTAAAKGELPGAVSNALMQRMSEWLTAAAAEALKEQPQRNVALAALIAGAASRDKTVDVNVRGLADKKHGLAYSKLPTFESVFKSALELVGNKQLLAIDELVSRALDFQVFRGDQKPLDDKGVAALCNAIEPNHMHRALRKHIDFADYFASVSKPMVLAALRESGLGEDGMKGAEKMSKSDLVSFAYKRMSKEADWFPPELRTANYKGMAGTPGKKPAAKSVKKRKS